MLPRQSSKIRRGSIERGIGENRRLDARFDTARWCGQLSAVEVGVMCVEKMENGVRTGTWQRKFPTENILLCCKSEQPPAHCNVDLTYFFANQQSLDR